MTWALDELADGNELTIVDDRLSAPTYAPGLAAACLSVGEEGATGLHHVTGPESVSRYGFTVALADAYGFDPDLVAPITTGEFRQEAPRPIDSTLDSPALYDAVGSRFRAPNEACDGVCRVSGENWPAYQFHADSLPI